MTALRSRLPVLQDVIHPGGGPSLPVLDDSLLPSELGPAWRAGPGGEADAGDRAPGAAGPRAAGAAGPFSVEPADALPSQPGPAPRALPLRPDPGRKARPLPRPGPLFGPCPMRPLGRPLGPLALADRVLPALLPAGWLHVASGAAARQRRFEQALQQPRNDSLPGLRAHLSRHGLRDSLVARTLRLLAELVQVQRGHRPYPGQLLAAWAMLDQRLVEMDTGEGKTLSLLLAAATAALAGVPVHVVTANDYLAARDADAARPLLQALGLRVGAIQAGHDAAERRRVYACEVVYASPRELGFDHLRDQVGGAADRVMRGLCLALVDEADSVLVDHARSPLVLARPAPELLPLAELQAVWRHAQGLRAGLHYTLDAVHRNATLVPAVAQALPAWGGDRRLGAQMLRQALVVRHLLQRDRDYLVDDGQVVLIDATTGRGNPGTQWSRGLHALVAVKEGCAPPPHTQPAAQVTLQTLFARYWQLGGASGTLREARLELALVYGLGVLRVRPRCAPQRRDGGVALFGGTARQFAAIAQAAGAQAAAGRPVLVGTDSVAASEALARHLRAAGLPVELLNARHGAEEPALLRQAGEPGAITVTTQVAGRGADIRPGPQALAAGGLHVICAGFNRSRRVDRQLLGRCARNGEPGSSQTVLALGGGELAREIARLWPLSSAFGNADRARTLPFQGRVPPWLARAGLGLLQRLLAAMDFYSRCQHLGQDRQARQTLAYTADAGGNPWTTAERGR
jgi:preprotein translocase subunit SecA